MMTEPNDNIPVSFMDYIPDALYGCANDYCAAETSYPADMLIWFPGFKGEVDEDGIYVEFAPGFYCEPAGCWQEVMDASGSDWQHRIGLDLLLPFAQQNATEPD